MVFSLVFSQNTEIKLSATGALISDPYNYCSSETLNLEVDDYASTTVGSSVTLPASTFNTIYNNTTGELPVPFNAAASITEKFSLPINLDFNFKFFNKTYTRVVVGSNGRLLFSNDARLDDLNDTSNFIDRTLIAPLVLLPSPQYNRVYKTGDLTREIKMAQIFAGFTKLRINPATGAYKYKKFDNGTNKGILIIFQSVIRNNGSGAYYGQFTNRVILFDDGRVVLNVKEEVPGPLYNAILGMQNEDGNEAIIPGNPPNPIYNNGLWTSFGTDAFVIKTGDIRTPTYSWELDRNNDGTIDQTWSSRVFPSYSPVSDIEKLSVKVTFLETPEVKISQVLFKKIKTPIIQGILHCSYEMSVTSATYDPTLRYTWYRVGSATAVGNGQIFSIHRQGGTMGDYYVKVTKFDGSPICPGADESNRLTYNKQQFPALIATSYCVTDNSLTSSPTKIVNLYTQFYPQYDPASGLEPYGIVFSTSSGIVSDPANFSLSANTPVNLQFAVTDITGASCYNGPLSLYYVGMPPAKTISLCASVTTYNLKLAFENPTYPTSYIYNYTYVDNGSTADGSAIDVTRKVNVRTSVAGCFTNTVVDFVLGATVTLPNVPMQERCAGSDTNANRFDFNLIKNTLDPTNQYDVKFYAKSTNQEIVPVTSSPTTIPNLNTEGYFWSALNGDYVIYAKVVDRADPSCFSISNDIILRVYTKPTLLVTSIPKSNCQGNSVFNLTQIPSTLTNASSPITVALEYYSTNGTLLAGSEITNYDADVSGQTPYVKVIYNVSCSDIIPFNLTYNPKPVAITTPILICAETTYSLQQFKDKVTSNSAQYTFTDLTDSPLPNVFYLNSLPLTVDFLIKDKTTGCVSDPQAVTFVKGTNSVLIKNETDYVLCDTDFDGKTTFNLDSKKNDFTLGGIGLFEYFKDASFTQSIGSSYPNETAFVQTVYVKITLPGFCPSTGKIHLKVNTPTRSTTLKDKYDICYGESLTIYGGSDGSGLSQNDAWEYNIDGVISNDENLYLENPKPGNYIVKLTNRNGCSYTHNFTISDENQPKIEVINQTNNSIEVIASGGTKPYRYYFNGIPQTSNILQNPTESSYEIQVESATGCFGPPKTIYFIKINNAFTPNGDGMNDTWKIENLDKMQEVSIVIINRNGTKVFESTNPSKSEWDGKSNGRELPTSSYWYVVTWFDAVTQKNEQRQGWILLKNRN